MIDEEENPSRNESDGKHDKACYPLCERIFSSAAALHFPPCFNFFFCVTHNDLQGRSTRDSI